MTDDVFLHWLTFVASLTALLILSRMTLLTLCGVDEPSWKVESVKWVHMYDHRSLGAGCAGNSSSVY